MIKILYKTKCDISGCKNIADCVFADEVDCNKKISLCNDCMKKIYECIAKTITPKGVDSPFKKQRKIGVWKN